MLSRCSAPVTARMLDRANLRPGYEVLDIASGGGEPAISVAQRVGPTGRVIDTDLVEDMLVHARAHAQQAGLNNIEFRCVDGELLDFDAGRFDAATMRWGLMFMPEPLTALRRIHQTLKAGARLAIATWAESSRNPFIGLCMEVLGRHCDLPEAVPGAPGIFAFADGDRLQSTLETAGFTDVERETLEFVVIEADTAQEYLSTLLDLAGPIAVLYGEMDATARQAFIDDFLTQLERHKVGDMIALHGTTWVAGATKS